MSTLLTYSVVALLCCWTQMELVSAGKEMLGPTQLKDWEYDNGKHGDVILWDFHGAELITEVGLTKMEAKSWFITPLLKLPKTSYLDITVVKTPVCNGKPCELEIYGTFYRMKTAPKKIADFLRKFESIQNSTFTNSNQSGQPIIITKAYTRLGIMVRTEQGRKKWSISSIKMYHYFCNESIINNTELDGKNSSSNDIQVNGTCQNNSFASDGKSNNIQVTCSTRGNWKFGNQTCLCRRGFGFTSQSGCSPCAKNYYKNESSNSACKKCPKGKINVSNIQCKCMEDRYPGGGNDNGPCYRLPAAVDNFNVRTTETSVNITWSKPLDDGGFNGTLTYSVECYYCSQSDAGQCNTPQKNAVFYPGKNGLTSTSVNVRGLTRNKRYKFRVTSMNNALKNVSREKWRYHETYGTPGSIITQAPTSTVTSAVNKTKEQAPKQCQDERDKDILIYVVAFAGLIIVLLIVYIVVTKVRRGKTNNGVDNHGLEIALPTVGQRVYENVR